MFIVIGLMFLGAILGYLFLGEAMLQKLEKPVNYTIYLLLFFLGISVGGNSEIIKNLPSLGGQAFLLALAGILGSVVASIMVVFLFKKDKKQSNH